MGSISAVDVNSGLTQLNIKRGHEISAQNTSVSKYGILRNLNPIVVDYIEQQVALHRGSTELICSSEIETLSKVNKSTVRNLVNVQRINNTRYINKYLYKVNEMLPDAGIYIGCAETTSIKKESLLSGKTCWMQLLIWLYCFIIHRVWPKIPKLNQLYFFLTKGRYRWLTTAEVLGRLVCSGFEIVEYKEIEGQVYFVVIKTKKPDYKATPSFAPIFKMKRIGKNGKMIKVYKLRTMHPFSEYLQDYVIRLNGYNHVGKPANDYRLAPWGKIFRKYWLDEIPQLINVLKGNMAIVGMRPLSEIRYNELPTDIREMRIKFKPGCIPPYVALNMPDKDSNIEAERIYMAEKMIHPLRTDVKYFFMAIYNIVAGKIRSA